MIFQKSAFCTLKCFKCLPEFPHWSRKAPRGSACGAQGLPKSPSKRFQELPFTILEHPKCFRIAYARYAGPKCIQKLSNSLPRAMLQQFSHCSGRFLTDFLWIWTHISLTSCWPNVGCNLPCVSSDLSMQWYFSSSEQLVNYILYIIYLTFFIIFYICYAIYYILLRFNNVFYINHYRLLIMNHTSYVLYYILFIICSLIYPINHIFYNKYLIL